MGDEKKARKKEKKEKKRAREDEDKKDEAEMKWKEYAPSVRNGIDSWLSKKRSVLNENERRKLKSPNARKRNARHGKRKRNREKKEKFWSRSWKTSFRQSWCERHARSEGQKMEMTMMARALVLARALGSRDREVQDHAVHVRREEEAVHE